MKVRIKDWTENDHLVYKALLNAVAREVDYPSDGKLIADKHSAILAIPVHSVYSYEYIPEEMQKNDKSL